MPSLRYVGLGKYFFRFNIYASLKIAVLNAYFNLLGPVPEVHIIIQQLLRFSYIPKSYTFKINPCKL